MKMSYPKSTLPFAAALSGFCVLLLTAAVPVSAQGDAPKEEKAIVMSAFNVTSTQPAPYQMAESTSGSRIAIPVFQTTQSTDIVTNQFINDVGADRMLDAVGYVSPGVSNGSQSTGADRVTIRGFQSDLHIYDGFQNSNLNKGFAQILDGYEVVKGPSAILSPFSPQPGGTINYITKKPTFSGNFGSISLEGGAWDSNFGSIDYNRVLSPHFAFRMVAVGVDDLSYTGERRKGYEFMPELTWRKGSAQLLVQMQDYKYETLVSPGVPVDYNLGTAASVSAKHMLPPGVKWNADFIDGDDYRNDMEHNYLAVFTDRVTDGLSVRVAAHVNLSSVGFLQFNNAAPVGSVSRAAQTNPLTGAYTPGFTYGAAAPFTATAIPLANETGAIWTRAASTDVQLYQEYDLQNDWSYEKDLNFMKTTTTAGVALTYEPPEGNRAANLPGAYSKANFDPANFVNSTATISGAPTIPSDTLNGEQITQYYISENLKFLKDRLILSGGLSENYMRKFVENVALPGFTVPSTNPLQPNPGAVNVHKLLKSYGIVVSPIPYAALYYGHSETSLPVAVVNAPGSSAITPSTANGLLPPTQDSKQDEAGIRFKTLDGRSTATIDYFQVYQSNNQIPNPANLSLAPGQPSFPPAFANQVSRGWEYEFNTNITKNISILGNYTHFHISNAFGQEIRAVAQSEGSIYANYKFTDDSFKGLSLGVGVQHVGRRAGDAPTAGSTAAGTAANPVAFKPTYYLPAYTVVNLTASYRINANWMIRAYVDNVLNEYYFTGALSRFDVFTGALRGYRGSVVYSF
jgi:iron complex outermembrane receptor protein